MGIALAFNSNSFLRDTGNIQKPIIAVYSFVLKYLWSIIILHSATVHTNKNEHQTDLVKSEIDVQASPQKLQNHVLKMFRFGEKLVAK